MKMKKITIIILLILAALSIVSCAKDDDAENAQRIVGIYNYLSASYNGEFTIVSNEPVILEDDDKSYRYKFVTDDDRQIEFRVYYEEGSLFDTDPHITSDLDYAIAEYVIAKSEFSTEYDITNEALEQTTENLYKLTIEEQQILEEYGLTDFTPLLRVHLVYEEHEIEFYFNNSGGRDNIFSGLLYEVINVDEDYHEDHDHD